MLRTAFQSGKIAFIPFIMAGYPSLDDTVNLVLMLARSGADLIELGVPFSDPVADGIVNQRAAQRALDQGVTLGDVLECVRAVRAAGCTTPILLFSYFNPLHAYGVDALISDTKQAGVNGFLVVDLPPEEGESFYRALAQAELGFALLVSPTTCASRYPLYAALKPSFIYAISRLAVTGTQADLSATLSDEVTAVRKALPGVPIAVGFGISTPEQVAAVARYADGVVVGSALVQALETHSPDVVARRVETWICACESSGASVCG